MSVVPNKALAALGAVALIGSIAYLAATVDLSTIGATLEAAVTDPVGLGVALAAYAAAFALRAGLWCRILPGLPFGQSLAAIHISLLGNHVLPLRLGEPLRVVSAVRRAHVPVAAATASTVLLRAADVLAVLAIAAALGPGLAGRLVGDAAIPLAVASALLLIAAAVWLGRVVRRRGAPLRGWLALAVPGAALAWLLESVLIWSCAGWAGVPVSPTEAALVTAVTIAAQTVAIAPGGIGTYEAAATAALVGVGADPAAALAAAVAAHALKTAYALITGAIAVFAPAPGLLGRLRLAAPPPPRPARARPAADAPVVLMLPACDEAATVAAVVGRAPARVAGRPVRVVVIDDGSRDATARLAAGAGARVVSVAPSRGLGAAVRRGLAEAVAERPAAVAFCDADGEYAPEELEALVAPILAGRADYVVGSRFRGTIRHMRLHRRLGNRVLTGILRLVARRPLTDGQSGYRALSPEAARDAEIGHDLNYAQVLTLDLLGKGYAYEEVPIGYAFREHGRSFVRLGPYLRTVVPAVYRELNGGRGGAAPSVLHDVVGEPEPGGPPGVVVERSVLAEAVHGGPGHREGVVGVVVHEEALPAEGQQGRPGRGPALEVGQVVVAAGAEDGIRVAQAHHLDPGHRGPR
jgi:uncharacterized membrane protein YbhN (UPF0104 family)